MSKIKNKKVLYAIIIVILIIVITTSFTYAYFSAISNNDNDIKGSTLDVSLGLKVNKISATGGMGDSLIPIYDGSITGHDSQLETASKSEFNCVDKNDYTVCQIYEVIISNNGGDDISVNTFISFDKKGVNNLKWALMRDENTVVSGNTHDITTNINDTIASDTLIKGKGSSKLYFMVYVNNTGSDQSEEDKDGFTGTVTVSATSGEEIYVNFNES